VRVADPEPEVPAVVRARPVRLRRLSALVAVVVLAVFVAVALLLDPGRTAGVVGPADQAAMVGLGVIAAAGVLMVGRPRLEADARGLRVRNLVGSRDVPWEVVRAVTFADRSLWASLDLRDDETVALMAVQALDGERAVRVVEALRALHRRYGTPG
jgi:Bacterial PH domain